MATDAAFGFGTPFAEQLDFFRRKLNLPSEAWDDITRQAHDRAFIVAGAAKADLVQDLRGAVADAMQGGVGLEAFKASFREVVAKNGWTGWRGEGTKRGEAWRARTIYQTNMASSYAAGRWRQMNEPAFAAERPFWRYVHAEGQRHPRPHHLAWHGLTLPRTHPFWQTHFAPNGWGCRCEIHPVRAPAAGAPQQPPAGWEEIDAKTGAPVGIDAGFDYAPGAEATTPLVALVDRKLFRLDAPIGAAMWKALAPAIAEERRAAYRAWLDEIGRSERAKSETHVVGAIDPADLEWLEREGYGTPATAEISIGSGVVNGPKAQRHAAAGDDFPSQMWEQLPELLQEPLAVLYDMRRGTLLYLLPDAGARRGQVAVVLRYAPRRGSGGNEVVSAYRPNLNALLERVEGGELRPIRGALG